MVYWYRNRCANYDAMLAEQTLRSSSGSAIKCRAQRSVEVFFDPSGRTAVNPTYNFGE